MKISENIELIADVKSFARNPFTSIGSYPKVLVTEEGGCLCSSCTKEKFVELLEGLRDGCGLVPQQIAIHWEGAPLVCDECYSDIESAYGDPWENEAEEF
jgi:hypothetical protein